MANVNQPFSTLPIALDLTGSEIVPLDQGGTTKTATVRQIAQASINSNFPAAIEYVIDSGGASMSTGIKGYLEVPFGCTINRVDLYGDQVGSCSIDIWRCTYDQFDAGITHPVAADSICAPNYPAFTAATKTSQTLNPPVNTALNATDVLGFYVNSVATLMRITVSIKVTRALY